MKYSLFACLLLCFSMAYSQSDLFVSDGSYVFVDGTGFSSGPTVAPLFVSDDVNLDNNGHIYLRNEAQLIQGTGVTGNSGLGQLSVYQTGNVNQWSYNYWCSPVGNNSIINGNESARVNLLNDITSLTTYVPATFTTAFNGNASPLIISDRWLWTYQTSNQYIDWVYAGSTGNILPGLGFTMKGNGTGLTGSQTYDFRGKPNNGTISNGVANGLNTLIGNPYPSAIDASLFIHDTDNQASITGKLLFWEQDGAVSSHVLQNYRGGYYSFTINASGTLITDTPAQFQTYDEQDNVFPLPIPTFGAKSFGRYIPIGQGFMVEGITGTPNSPALVYTKNSHRVFAKESDGQSLFFRDASHPPENGTLEEIQYQENGLSIVPSDFKRFRINVDFTVNESQYTRQLVLNFHDSATSGFDYGMELITTEISDSDAYFSFDQKTYNAQAYPFEEALVIPLAIDIEEQQPLRFRIFDIQNFDESQGIYIHDIENELYVNLRDQDYDLNIESGNYTDRFEIVFTSGEALGINDFDLSKLTINQDNNIHQLSVLNPNGLDVKSIEVYDITGKRMLNNQYDSVSNRYDLSTINLSDAVYVAKVTSSTNTIKSEKIIVKN